MARVDADGKLSGVPWSERRSSSESVVLGRAVRQLAAEMERLAGFGAHVAVVDTPPRAWVDADNAALVAESSPTSYWCPAGPRSDVEDRRLLYSAYRRAAAAPVVVLSGCVNRGQDTDQAADVGKRPPPPVCPGSSSSRRAGCRSPTTPTVYVRRESSKRWPVARRRYGPSRVSRSAFGYFVDRWSARSDPDSGG